MHARTGHAVRLCISIALFCAVLGPASALFCGTDNCYELLGLKRDATKADIRRAYRRLSLEKHPDKHPGNEKIAEEFRRIADAYTALKDDAKRAQYDDFLDNPGKYWHFLVQNSREFYAPKTNVVIAFSLILGVATLIHWLHMNNAYKTTLERMRQSPEYKREITRLVKSKAAANAEEADAMIDLEVVGLEEPHWRNLVLVQLLYLPVHLYKYLAWYFHWQYSYRLLKREYTDDDKLYLIKKNLEISDREWERMSDPAQRKLFDQRLWDKEQAAEYMRLERIALNRDGKLRKRKKQQSGALSADSEDFN